MVTNSGKLALVYNGEIYNFVDLRAELLDRGHSFRGSGDTEVVLQSYREWGIACVERFVGMFALAIYDAANQCLLLVRDRVGEKPLYYFYADRELRFASELKALFSDRTIQKRLDPRALDEYLAYGYVAGQRTVVEGFRKLKPGHVLRFDLASGDVREWRWWKAGDAGSLTGEHDRGADPEALVERLEQHLTRSIRGQLIADVPIGVLLSGGIDSSLVTAIAAKVAAGRIRTFTVTFPGHGAFDEGPAARLVAEYFDTEHFEIEAGRASPMLVRELAAQYDEPLGDSSMIPTYLVSKAIRDHATVALGGDGGDELFGGYPHYQWLIEEAPIRRWMPEGVSGALAAFARALPTGVRGRHRTMGLEGPWGRRLGRVNLLFDRRERLRLSPYLESHCDVLEDPPEDDRWPPGLDRAASPVVGAMLGDFSRYLPADLLTKVDRAGMLASLEIRSPFLDYRLVEFAFGEIPLELKVDRKRRKILLRRLAARVLPPSLPLDRKRGFSVPLHDWFSGPWREFLLDEIDSMDEALFRREAVCSLRRGLRFGLQNVHRLYAILFLHLWAQHHDVSLS